jgi:hypothetical protein
MAEHRPYRRVGEAQIVRKRGERMPKNVWSNVIGHVADHRPEQVRKISGVVFAASARNKEQVACRANVLQNLNRSM